jgi:hypothetical protein
MTRAIASGNGLGHALAENAARLAGVDEEASNAFTRPRLLQLPARTWVSLTTAALQRRRRSTCSSFKRRAS